MSDNVVKMPTLRRVSVKLDGIELPSTGYSDGYWGFQWHGTPIRILDTAPPLMIRGSITDDAGEYMHLEVSGY